MSVKYFCDVCHQEIKDPRTHIQVSYGILVVELRRSVNGDWNDGHVCNECLLQAVKYGDIRPFTQEAF